MNTETSNVIKPFPYLKHGGEMGALIRSFDWSITSIGDPGQWPQSLLTSVNLLLNSKFPMFVWWGKEKLTIYNDAYKLILGEKHPGALGNSGPVVWEEIWDVVGPMADEVMEKGVSTWSEDQLLFINRQGYMEESYFTFSYSPVYDDEGKVAGIFCACTETTGKVIAGRGIKRSEENLRNIILHAPVAMCILSGEDFTITVANDKILELWGRSKEELYGRPIFEGLPEARGQGFEELLQQVYRTGKTYKASGVPIRLPRENRIETIYINFVYEAFRDAENNIVGIMVVAIDVTDQILNQKSIEESAQEIRAMVESAPFPIGVYAGREMRIKLANQTIMNTWGKGNDVIGKTYAEVLPELRNQSIYQQLDDVYTTGIPFHAKNQRVDLMVNGKLQPFYFNYSFTPLFDSGNRVYGVMNTAADVTDLNIALQKISVAEEKARLAIDTSELGTFELDYERNEIYTSERFQEIWGPNPGNRHDHYINVVHPDDRTIRTKAYERAMQTGHLDYEVRIIPTDGEVRWIRIKGRMIFDSQNKLVRSIGVTQDITENKLFAEELSKQVKLRTVELEQARQTLYESYNYLQNILNKFETPLATLVPIFENGEIIDFRFKLTNEAYSAYSGLSPAENQNRIASEVFPEYKQTEAFEKYVTTYHTGKDHKWDLHYNVDGLDVHLTVICSRMDDEVVVHFTDFTELKNLQLDLMKNIDELKRSNRNLEDFAYAASHDLKEPIRKIHFFSDRLKNEIREKLSAEQIMLFDKLENATKRMRTLVDDLLSYSQVNVKPAAYERVDLNELIKLVQTDLELEIEEKQANIIIADLPVVEGYSRQLQQLFQNLLSNSLKYRNHELPLVINIECSEIKGTDLTVMLTAEQKLKNYYLVSVSDNGIGFEQEKAEFIFHVFHRLHGNSEYRGTGVGLSIARKVAENHNGFIWAKSSPGQGARFELVLPVIQNR